MGKRDRPRDTDRPLKVVSLPLEWERSLDLQIRAKQMSQLQILIGEMVAGLLANGKPISVVVSTEKMPSLNNKERAVVNVYWQETEMPGTIVTNDLPLQTRCLKCADYVMGEHKCRPALNQNPEEKVSGPNEARTSKEPPDSETGPVSTDSSTKTDASPDSMLPTSADGEPAG
jgi:hypothetical protein